MPLGVTGFVAADLGVKFPNYGEGTATAPNKVVYAKPGTVIDTGLTPETATSIWDAITKINNGDTIVLRGGTYQVTNQKIYCGKKVTIQPYRFENPVFSGFQAITGWTLEGSSGKWVADYPDLPDFSSQQSKPETQDVGANEAYKLDMHHIFVNSQRLLQVGSKAAVTSTSYYIDKATKKVYLSADATNKTVEFCRPYVVFEMWGSEIAGSKLRGLTVRGGAFNGARIHGNAADNMVIENCKFINNGFKGLQLNRSVNTIVRNCEAKNNGYQGMAINTMLDGMVRDCLFESNNNADYQTNWSAAGCKFTRTERSIVLNCKTLNNMGNGIWYDIECFELHTINCDFNNDAVFSLFYEISEGNDVGFYVYGNTFRATNQGVGLEITSCKKVKVINNTFYNHLMPLIVKDSGRARRPQPQDLANNYPTYIQKDAEIYNNLFIGRAAALDSESESTFYKVLPYETDLANSYVKTIKTNAYYQTAALTPKYQSIWGWGTLQRYTTLAAMKTGRGVPEYEVGSEFYPNFSGTLPIDTTTLVPTAASTTVSELPDYLVTLAQLPGQPKNLGAYQTGYTTYTVTPPTEPPVVVPPGTVGGGVGGGNSGGTTNPPDGSSGGITSILIPKADPLEGTVSSTQVYREGVTDVTKPVPDDLKRTKAEKEALRYDRRNKIWKKVVKLDWNFPNRRSR